MFVIGMEEALAWHFLSKDMKAEWGLAKWHEVGRIVTGKDQKQVAAWTTK